MTGAFSSSNSERLSWMNFSATYLSADVPAHIRLLEYPLTSLTYDPQAERLALRIDAAKDENVLVEVPQYLIARHVLVRGQRLLELLTQRSSLYRPFFFLVLSIVDHLSGGASPVQSLARALRENRELLQLDSHLSDDALTGLFGELWTLRLLIEKHGNMAIETWTGARKLPHDFRFGQRELEIKTTRAAIRTHRIHGATQLLPSLGCSLYLISIAVQIAGPGGGQSIPELVDEIRATLSDDTVWSSVFDRRLSECGYSEQHVSKYALRLILRDRPMLIPVNEDFPRLIQPQINALSGDAGARISDVEYTVNVEGLGSSIDAPVSMPILSASI
jgi:hypothetical protein